jgi:hypothetical protein
MQPVEIEHVPLPAIASWWPRVERALAWDVARYSGRKGVLKAALTVGTQALWVAPHGRFPTQLASVIITTIVPSPKRQPPVLKIELLSGRHAGTWMESAACKLSAYAQAHGCTRITVVGRKGWRHYRSLFTLPVSWAYDEMTHADPNHQQPAE